MTGHVSPRIEQQLRAGGRAAWEIALDLGVTPSRVYEVARKIGVKPKRPNRGEGIAAFPYPEPFKARDIRDIRDDLHNQLADMFAKFRRQVNADRKADPIT